jgi:hypothetical protein
MLSKELTEVKARLKSLKSHALNVVYDNNARNVGELKEVLMSMLE